MRSSLAGRVTSRAFVHMGVCLSVSFLFSAQCTAFPPSVPVLRAPSLPRFILPKSLFLGELTSAIIFL
jgi:hypothetical protein